MHLMTDAAAAVREVVKSVADLNPTFMSPDEKAEAMLAWCELETRVTEVRLRIMASASDVADAEGFRSSATWLAHHARLRRADAAADLQIAEALDRERSVLATALREGRVNLAQARVIAHALAGLPAHVGSDVLERAEAELVHLAEVHDPKELSVLGRRILEVVDPERFEHEEARRLAESERRAQEKQRLSVRAVGDGTTRISAVVPDAVAARLTTYLHAFTNPRLCDGAVRATVDDEANADDEAHVPSGFGTPVNHPRRLAEAFGQLLEVLDPGRLPVHGGDATHVTVTVRLDALVAELGTAAFDNETSGDGFGAMTAAQARRLACTARIIPAVLGADSEVLDLGRSTRLFTKAQRRALLLRDRTCRVEGCSVPGAWSEAHHLDPWSRGGGTDLENGVLLCSRHHHRAHDETYDMTRLASGDVRFARRT